jgi:hypothetical protein
VRRILPTYRFAACGLISDCDHKEAREERNKPDWPDERRSTVGGEGIVEKSPPSAAISRLCGGGSGPSPLPKDK